MVFEQPLFSGIIAKDSFVVLDIDAGLLAELQQSIQGLLIECHVFEDDFNQEYIAPVNYGLDDQANI